ncbi:MAG: CHAD domain-containing protein [Chloroflexota bacterium]|nr:CHAD domain-containing protein [Chloroflexota bacterium]
MDTTDNTDQQEIEWQFDVEDVNELRSWLAGDGSDLPVAVRELPSRKLVDLYLDTEDQRLRRAGYSLRIRTTDGQVEATMKALVASTDGVRKRREITEHIKQDGLRALQSSSGPVATRARLLAGRSSLQPLFQIRTRRLPFELEVQGRALGELTIDDSRFLLGDQPVHRLSRVEVELVPGGEEGQITRFVDRLRAEHRASVAVASKYETGLAAAGIADLTQPDIGPTSHGDAPTTGEVAYAVLRTQVLAILKHEPGTRLGEDSEELHDMRVAIRRSRAAMSLFRDFLPPDVQRLREELGRVARVLGEVRDLDVQIEQLAAWERASGEGGGQAFKPVRDILTARRERARRRMVQVLDSRRYERILTELQALLSRGPGDAPEAASISIFETAPDLIQRRYRKLKRRGKNLNSSSPPEEYHELRINGKRLRYALEFLRKVYGEPVQALIPPLTRLQDLLGAHQDAEVAMSQLAEMAAKRGKHLPPRTLFAMGGVAERYRTEAGQLRKRFPSRFKKVRGRPWKHLRAELEARRPQPPESV